MSALLGRLLRRPVLSAAVLAALAGWFTTTIAVGRLPGAWFIVLVVVGLAMAAIGALRVVHRVAATPAPRVLRPLVPHTENLLLLAAINLIVLSPLAPIFTGIAQGMAANPYHNPIARQAFEAVGGLTGRVLLALFSAGIVVAGWLLLVRVAGPALRRLPGARRLGAAIDALFVAGAVVFCAASIVLSFNGALDRSPATTRGADLVAVSSLSVPFGAGVLGWADVRYLDAPQRVERLLLMPRDEVWPERALAGLPVRVAMRRGLLGIPWVQAVTLDRARDLRRALAAVPGAAVLRKSLIDTLLTERRWDDVQRETEAHLRAYPEDTQFALSVSRQLRAAGQPARAVALDRLAEQP